MALTQDEIDQNLLCIFTGSKVEYINNGEKDVYVKFKHPTNEIKAQAAIVYKVSYRKAIEEGMLPSEELEKLIEERGIITEEDKLKLIRLEGQLEAQEILLGKTTQVKANQDRIKKVINKIKDEINSIKYKKASKMILSAETKAEEDRTSFFCSKCTFYEDDVIIWNSFDTILKETNIKFKDRVLINFLQFYSGIDTKIVRELSRSSLWRIRFITSQKTSDQLFGIPTSEYTNDMLNLAYWSNYYQNIYEMMPEDRPSDLLIDDDEALDAYMKSYYDDRSREDAARRSKAGNKGRLSAFDQEEVIVTRSHELYEDIEYHQPREAQRIKDRTDIKKRTLSG